MDIKKMFFYIYGLKTNNILLIGAGLLAVLLLTSSKNMTGDLDLSQLNDTYGADNVQRLQNLYNVLLNANLTNEQIMLMLSQALVETGLFTDSPNYNNMDNLNNFAGINGNSRYAAAPGSMYAKYPNLTAFVGDWLTVLGMGSDPLDATSVLDFVNRLKSNNYFEDDFLTYLGNMNSYYDILLNVAQPINA